MTLTSPSPRIAPRRMLLRWAAASLVLLLVAAFLVAMTRFYTDKFHRTTGEASWLWSTHRIAADTPEAFFLARELDLPPAREFVRIRVAAEPEYTLWFNGVEVGGGMSDGTRLWSWDVSGLAREGRNRVVIAVRSPRGVGGVLATVDLGPMRRNWLVTDRRWKLYTRWSEALIAQPDPTLPVEQPRVLGRPPFGRWNYPEEQPGIPYGSRREFLHPEQVIDFASSLPKIEVKSGVAVAGRIEAIARAFDFGPVSGRAALRVAPGPRRAIAIRYASRPDELAGEGAVESLVVGEGEREVVTPQRRTFRYLVVYDEPAEARVVTD
ncbi:MAG TPA: hypothetical protein VMS56_04970 [Thermoanaerobaculia bacterium]|nr:hypothetical protein [Thermoanaerobaculia bacterium]